MKRILMIIICMLFSLTVNAAPSKVATLVTGTATGVGEKFTPWSPKRTFHVIGGTSAGAGASTVDVEVSNDATNWVSVDTLSLTLGTAVTSDTYSMDAPWAYVRGNITAISGTGASVTLYMGGQVR